MTRKEYAKSKSPKLSDTQLIILSEASQRPGNLIVLPARLKGSAGTAAIAALLRRDYIGKTEIAPNSISVPGSRFEGPNGPIFYRVTASALKLLGIDSEPSEGRASDLQPTTTVRPRKTAKNAKPSKNLPTQKTSERVGTKQAMLLARLERSKGATLEELVSTAEWQAHSVRGFLSGTIKGKLGRNVERTTDAKRNTNYRIIK